jgi:hypothetical protein
MRRAVCVLALVFGGCSSESTEEAECKTLDEAACKAAAHCGPITGSLPGAPTGETVFLACNTGNVTGGTAISCMAAGPGETCYRRPDTLHPEGWSIWGCDNPQTQAECMANAPF